MGVLLAENRQVGEQVRGGALFQRFIYEPIKLVGFVAAAICVSCHKNAEGKEIGSKAKVATRPLLRAPPRPTQVT
jgi:hypothetical protein